MFKAFLCVDPVALRPTPNIATATNCEARQQMRHHSRSCTLANRLTPFITSQGAFASTTQLSSTTLDRVACLELLKAEHVVTFASDRRQLVRVLAQSWVYISQRDPVVLSRLKRQYWKVDPKVPLSHCSSEVTTVNGQGLTTHYTGQLRLHRVCHVCSVLHEVMCMGKSFLDSIQKDLAMQIDHMYICSVLCASRRLALTRQ